MLRLLKRPPCHNLLSQFPRSIGRYFWTNKAVEVSDRLHCGNGNVLQDQMKQEKNSLGIKRLGQSHSKRAGWSVASKHTGDRLNTSINRKALVISRPAARACVYVHVCVAARLSHLEETASTTRTKASEFAFLSEKKNIQTI